MNSKVTVSKDENQKFSAGCFSRRLDSVMIAFSISIFWSFSFFSSLVLSAFHLLNKWQLFSCFIGEHVFHDRLLGDATDAWAAETRCCGYFFGNPMWLPFSDRHSAITAMPLSMKSSRGVNFFNHSTTLPLICLICFTSVERPIPF